MIWRFHTPQVTSCHHVSPYSEWDMTNAIMFLPMGGWREQHIVLDLFFASDSCMREQLSDNVFCLRAWRLSLCWAARLEVVVSTWLAPIGWWCLTWVEAAKWWGDGPGVGSAFTVLWLLRWVLSLLRPAGTGASTRTNHHSVCPCFIPLITLLQTPNIMRKQSMINLI